MTELQNIAQHCCNGFTSSLQCPFNRKRKTFLNLKLSLLSFKIYDNRIKANVRRRCIDGNANVMLADGSLKSVKSLEIGDKVKTLDANGQLVDTDVVMIMDIANQECKFSLKFTF